MAFSHFRPIPNRESVISYNFDKRVTKFGGTNKVDVMLLQALLRMLYYEFPKGSDNFKFPIPSRSSGPIVVDGIVGEQTRRHIEDYQARVKSFGGKIILDGVIDPYPTFNARTLHTKETFLLDFLNVRCNNAAVDAGQRTSYTKMIDVPEHADIYDESLRSALRIPR